MTKENYIAINELCSHYKVEMSFFSNLNEFGLLELRTIEKTQYISIDKLNDLEKMLRLHQELNINTEGIDIVFNLLDKINNLQEELTSIKNRLRLYEDENL